MTFDPKESIDFDGNTGPFIQYTHARIKSVLRKAAEQGIEIPKKLDTSVLLSEKGKRIGAIACRLCEYCKTSWRGI